MTLHEIGLQTGTDKATYHGFAGYYNRKLADIKARPSGLLLELGIYKGASLEMWSKWLPNFGVFGADIDTKQINRSLAPNVRYGQVDCGDEMLIRKFANDILTENRRERFDVVIDDASHLWSHQKAAFRALWPLTEIYIIEDLHTSIRKQYSGGADKPPYCDGAFDLDFGVPVQISMFQGQPSDSWTCIIRRKE